MASHGFVRSYGSITLWLRPQFRFFFRHDVTISVDGDVRKILPTHGLGCNVGHFLKRASLRHRHHFQLTDAHLIASFYSITKLHHEKRDGGKLRITVYHLTP